MTTILHITSSPRGAASRSTLLSHELVGRLIDQHPDARVVRRDLAARPVRPVDDVVLAALVTAPAERTAEQQAIVAERDALIEELLAADVVVIATPMYNFAIPTQLKAYFDAIARAGVTFRYGAEGPVGLVTGKQVFVVFARGGKHRGTPGDSQTPYVRTMLGFLGMTDVELVYAEGLDMGPDFERAGLADARQAIQMI